eukprot:scpid93211/ scgid19528/ 
MLIAVMKCEGAIEEVEETFKNAEEVASIELLKLVKDLNTRNIFRQDKKTNKFTTNAVQLSVIPTRVTRIVVRVGTVGIDKYGLNTKLPEVVCDTTESRKRRAYESESGDLSDPLVRIQASESSQLIEVIVSRKRSWTVPSVHVFELGGEKLEVRTGGSAPSTSHTWPTSPSAESRCQADGLCHDLYVTSC